MNVTIHAWTPITPHSWNFYDTTKTDEGNAAWLSVINAHLERLKRDPHCGQLKALRAATVREDWPEQRDKTVAEIRTMIQQASHNGKALVISNRLYGSGPHKKLFDG